MRKSLDFLLSFVIDLETSFWQSILAVSVSLHSLIEVFDDLQELESVHTNPGPIHVVRIPAPYRVEHLWFQVERGSESGRIVKPQICPEPVDHSWFWHGRECDIWYNWRVKAMVPKR